MRLGLVLGLVLCLGLALVLRLLCLLWPLPGPVGAGWLVSGCGWGILGVRVAQAQNFICGNEVFGY